MKVTGMQTPARTLLILGVILDPLLLRKLYQRNQSTGS